MENIWELLQIEKTRDLSAIRRAYAEQAKKFHPEEAPEEFLRIRQAYEEAIAYAGKEIGSYTVNLESDREAAPHPETQHASETSEKEYFRQGEWSEKSDASGSTVGFRWDFTEENSFRDGEGIRKFRELYTGKRRKDRAAWSDYFVSAPFLAGYREKEFAELMLEIVRENGEENPPSKEFLTELFITYGLQAERAGEERKFKLGSNAAFPGIGYIWEIAAMGPAITRFKGNDPAMAEGFQDYRELLRLSQNDVWDDNTLLAMGKIVDNYSLSNISDRPIGNAYQYELRQRHPKSLKLVTYFFSQCQETNGFPEKVYRLLWSRLGLESATNGREKMLYGGLRETVLAHVPGILEKPKVDFKQLSQEFYYNRTGRYYMNDGETQKDREDLDAFLRREDVRYALLDEGYVDRQVMRYWITRNSGDYLLDKLEEFYNVYRDAPLAGRLLEKIAEQKKNIRVDKALKQDGKAAPDMSRFDISERPYLRYYLHTAFHLARGMQNDVILTKYLQEKMPYSEEWGRKMAEQEAEGGEECGSWEIRFGESGEDVLSVFFHYKYVEYLWNGSPLVPYYPGTFLAEVEDDNYFWLLAPVSAAPYEAYSNIYETLARRLSRLPLEQEDIPVIADCIAGSICYAPEEELPLGRFYERKQEQLFSCHIYEDRLELYQEQAERRVLLSKTNYGALDLMTAVRMGKRILEEMVMDWDLRVHLALLPEAISVKDKWNLPRALEGEEVTQEAIRKLLQEFFQQKLLRLELNFGGRALVFLKDGQVSHYACMYFEDERQSWYSFVGKPEIYEMADEKDARYVAFGLGMLPDYLVHNELGHMGSRLEEIFDQVACKDPEPAQMTWSSRVYLPAEAQQYRLVRRLFGAYPPHQACNRLQDPFYLPEIPSFVYYIDLEGNGAKEEHVLKDRVQEALGAYMAEKLNLLVLGWKAGTGKYQWILLVQDQGRHQMIYMEDFMDGGYMLAANVEEYLAAEGKKYRKEIFFEKKVPGYLVHTNLRRIRDCLDILMPEIRNPYAILRRFGEFAYTDRDNMPDFVKRILVDCDLMSGDFNRQP